MEAADDLARQVTMVLRVAMFCIGARSIGDLRATTRLYRPADLAALEI